MKTIFIILFLLVASFRLAADFTGKTVGVSDGDTITVLCGGKGVKVRLYGIDCPESSQDFGQAAKKFTSNMVYGRTVEVKEKGTDQYGRTVGIVTVSGKNLNLELLNNGLAWYYKTYAKKEKDFASAQARAKASRTGLWTLATPIPPWEYRRELRNIEDRPERKSPEYSISSDWAAILVAILALLSGVGAKRLLRSGKKSRGK